jgi:hypothetical protein
LLQDHQDAELGKGKVDETEGELDVLRQPGGGPTACRVD